MGRVMAMRVCIPMGRPSKKGPWAVVDGPIIIGRYHSADTALRAAMHRLMAGKTMGLSSCKDCLKTIAVDAVQKDLFA